MKNYLSITLFFIFIIMTSLCFSQSNYKTGYIITNSNDTVYGQIDYRTDAMNATRCKFRAQDNSSEKTYYPGDIKSYRFTPEGKYYISNEVIINYNTKQVFLEYLVKGMVDLYYCDIQGKKYYFFEKDGEMIELTKNADIIENGYVVSDNKYKGRVQFHFKEYSSITNMADKMDFNQKSFINIAKMYHEETCTTGEDCIVYVNKNPDENSIKLKFSAYVGVQFSTYTIVNQTYYGQFVDIDLNSTQPVIGARMNMYNPRWSKSFSIQMDMYLSKFSYSDEVIYNNILVHHKIKSMNISGKLGLEYNLLINKIQPRIGAGGVYTHFFSDDGKFRYVNGYQSGYDYKIRRSYIGYFINAGIDFIVKKEHAITLQASMEGYTNGDATENRGRDKFGSYNLTLGYTF